MIRAGPSNEAFLKRDMLPLAKCACYVPSSVKIRSRISAMRYPYKPEPMRREEETQADIPSVQPEHRNSLTEIVPMASRRATLSPLVGPPKDVDHEM